MRKNTEPTESQKAIASIRAMPKLKRTAMAYTFLLSDLSVKGRRVRRAFDITGRQFRKALRQAKADKAASETL